MAESKKMKCPDCGVDMNFHAEKLDYTAALAEPEAADPDLGGVLEEVHTCPQCGTARVRHSS